MILQRSGIMLITKSKIKNVMTIWMEDDQFPGVYYNSNPSPTTFFPISTHYRSMRYRGIERSGIRESMYDFYHFKPSEGQIILFPPYLEHEVKSVLDDKDGRLTFSFNLVLQR